MVGGSSKIRRRAILVATCLIGFGWAARAADSYPPFHLDKVDRTAIVLDGVIDERSALNFRRALAARPHAKKLVLQSPGGVVQIGLLIAEEVYERGMETTIPFGQVCASACSFVFLAGRERSAQGSLGVHQLNARKPDIRAVQTNISDILELLGKYGTPREVLTRMFGTPPEKMHFFSATEMAGMGLLGRQAVTTVPVLPKSTVPPAPSKPDGTSPKQWRRDASNNFGYISPKSLPDPQSGAVLHPSGAVELKQRPVSGSRTIAKLANRTKLQILGSDENWYSVRVSNRRGWLHHSWVHVDQFAGLGFEKRYVQIKSFQSLPHAEAFVNSSTLLLAAFVATNGWIAITLEEPVKSQDANAVLERLKHEKRIPDDSFATYGNNYMVRLCCQW